MISLTVAKAQVRMEQDFHDEDGLLVEMIDSARRTIERRTGWYLGEPTEVTWYLHGTGTDTLWLSQPPNDPEEVTVAADGTTMLAAEYAVRGRRLVRKAGWDPRVEYTVTGNVGWNPDQGPEDLRQATRLLVGGWFANREDYLTLKDAKGPLRYGVELLLGTYERIRS